MYDALLSGATDATAQERALLQSVRAQVANWRLRKRFETAAGAEAYRKATAFEALVSLTETSFVKAEPAWPIAVLLAAW